MKNVSRSNLVFISNEVMGSRVRNNLGIPMTFLSLAIIEAKMYKHFRNQGTFITREGKEWGNKVVYGALFAIQDFQFYISILDAYHKCSMSILGSNNQHDMHHREETTVTPITVNSIEELERLKYQEREPIEANVYFGNTKNPKIYQRLNKSVSYRIIDGIDQNFIKLYREEIG